LLSCQIAEKRLATASTADRSVLFNSVIPSTLTVTPIGNGPRATDTAVDQIALAAIFTVRARIVTLKKKEMMPWAVTV
jgi:hypothetical protein